MQKSGEDMWVKSMVKSFNFCIEVVLLMLKEKQFSDMKDNSMLVAIAQSRDSRLVYQPASAIGRAVPYT